MKVHAIKTEPGRMHAIKSYAFVNTTAHIMNVGSIVNTKVTQHASANDKERACSAARMR